MLEVSYLLYGGMVLHRPVGILNSAGISVGVSGNKLWEALLYRIRDFAINYEREFNLDNIKIANSIDYRIAWVGIL